MTDITFDCMGTHVRLLVRDERDRASRAASSSSDFEAALSRFRPDSELCRLNADPRAEVAGLAAAAHRDLRGPVAAELTGRARRSDAHRRARGRRLRPHAPRRPSSRSRRRSRHAPPRRPATADPLAPGGTRHGHRPHDPPPARACGFDTGGTGKGLAADLLALAAQRRRWAVDCGGDLRGLPATVRRRRPPPAHAARPIHTLQLDDGAVATSGLDRRLWRAPDGTPRHHLLDPATQQPGVDRRDRRHRARADRDRGRGARQGRAAQRPAARQPLAAPPRRADRPRRRRRRSTARARVRIGRWRHEPAGARRSGWSAARRASSRSCSSPSPC